MNSILYACNLESRPRWLDLGKNCYHKYNLSCSNCGECVHKRIAPKKCPNCKSEMKTI